MINILVLSGFVLYSLFWKKRKIPLSLMIFLLLPPIFRIIGIVINIYLQNMALLMEVTKIKKLVNIMYIFDGLTYIYLMVLTFYFRNRVNSRI